MELLARALLVTYFATLGTLAVYGAHRLHLVWLFYRHRKKPRASQRPLRAAPLSPARTRSAPPAVAPHVTVQIPIYNEYNVAPRLIEAVCRLDHPRDRLEIQVLDDSTDGTRSRVAEIVATLRGRGHDIHHLCRDGRDGFKAGALAAGLERARGEFIAVFDADFVPPAQFLRETLRGFDDPAVGMVQARWGHLNRSHSILTRVQALLLDGHFLIEHSARNLTGRFFNFNGTAGIWRRRCIEEAGGWQHDTLTEDLDLSYRAQLAGWKFLFLPETVAPAELPAEISAFKSQQHRWAKGSIQTARKILPRLLFSSLPVRVKIEALFHLTANFAYVLMVLLALLLLPVMVLRARTSWQIPLLVDLPLLLFATVSFWIFYLSAGKEGYGEISSAVRTMPALMSVGIGLSLNNAHAVLEGLAGGVGTFERTPKHRIEDGCDGSPAIRYRVERLPLPWLEGLLAIYVTLAIAFAALYSLWSFLPFLALFWSGFVYMAGSSLLEASRVKGAS